MGESVARGAVVWGMGHGKGYMADRWPSPDDRGGAGRSGGRTTWHGSSAIVAVCLCLTGCTTVVDLAGLPRPGLQPNGSYVLTAAESQADCRALNERIESDLVVMKKQLPRIEKEQAALPDTVTGVLERTFGGVDAGSHGRRTWREAEGRARALDKAAGEKGCLRPDIDDRIKSASAPPPQPI
ncbi:MAG: hypothetical protein AB7E80_14625 [Hyphomicrobiaceae bacterium]